MGRGFRGGGVLEGAGSHVKYLLAERIGTEPGQRVRLNRRVGPLETKGGALDGCSGWSWDWKKG